MIGVKRTFTQNGTTIEVTELTFGKDRTVTFKRLSMGDQFDLAVALPEGATGLAGGYARIAASVVLIDGKPRWPGVDKKAIRATLDNLGEEGVLAVNRAMVDAEEAVASDDAEAALKAQVGNSPETPASEG